MLVPENLNVFALTWNVNGKSPTEDMTKALQLDNSTFRPDFYVFSLQEAPVTISNAVVEDPWSGFFRSLLAQHDYIKVNEVKMQAIHLLVFTKRPIITKIRDVEINWTRTGFGGWWGNKGGVSLRLTINGCHICFVSCHLAAHDNKLDQRISDYKRIVYGQRFEQPKTQHILSHDQVVIMGDLNFRIDDFSSDDIYSRIVEGSPEALKSLLDKDQVTLTPSGCYCHTCLLFLTRVISLASYFPIISLTVFVNNGKPSMSLRNQDQPSGRPTSSNMELISTTEVKESLPLLIGSSSRDYLQKSLLRMNMFLTPTF
jgi:hypothetical protein